VLRFPFSPPTPEHRQRFGQLPLSRPRSSYFYTCFFLFPRFTRYLFTTLLASTPPCAPNHFFFCSPPHTTPAVFAPLKPLFTPPSPFFPDLASIVIHLINPRLRNRTRPGPFSLFSLLPSRPLSPSSTFPSVRPPPRCCPDRSPVSFPRPTTPRSHSLTPASPRHISFSCDCPFDAYIFNLSVSSPFSGVALTAIQDRNATRAMSDTRSPSRPMHLNLPHFPPPTC